MSFEPFRPRFPWYGRHLQSLRNPLRPAPRLPNGPGRRLAFRLPDGDALQARHDAPLERDRAAPSILLIHGLGGCETSNYMLAASAFFTRAGSDVYRLNLRGAGPSQATCRGWSHAGRHRDLEAVIPELPVGRSGIVAIGFSLGGNLLLNHLARGAVDDGLRAAASVSAPIDLAAACTVIHAPRNRLYHDYLLRALKADYLNPHSSLTAVEQEAVRSARTLFEVDDRFTAPHHGFGRAEVYYRSASARRYLDRITRPTLLVHAVDDPFIPPDAYLDAGGPAVTVLLAEGGGHLGFHDGAGLWHLRQVQRFAKAVPMRSAKDLSARERLCS